MSLLPPSATVKILEMINMCSKGVKYCKNSEMSHIYMFRLLVIINPIRFLVLVVMHVVYFVVYL